MRESNKLLVLYTKQFGLIYVSTQSIRELKSKMRFHTHALSLVDVDVVEGRDIWKLTGIHEHLSSLPFAGTLAFSMLQRLSTFIMRLSSGEEYHDRIWEDIQNVYRYVQEHPHENKETYHHIEIVFLIRLLNHLGYWEGNEDFLLTSYPFTRDIFEVIDSNHSYFIQRINLGIQNSQL